MPTTLHTFVDLYRRQLDTAAHLLTKGAAHAVAHGIAERTMLGWRLAGDMHPLAFQLTVVPNFSYTWLARAGGVEAPPRRDAAQIDVAGIHAAIAETQAFLATLTPERFEGRDDLPATFEIMPDLAPTFTLGHWVSVFATTNIYFHSSTAYAILRANGVTLGKVDMFSSGL